MQKNFIVIGSASAALAVILGAFGAHALKARLGPDQLQVFETGVKYQFYHAFALIIVAMLMERYTARAMTIAGWSFLAGMICFCGSLYLLSCREMLQIDNWRWLGPVTPLGGLFFIVGWVSLLTGVLKSPAL